MRDYRDDRPYWMDDKDDEIDRYSPIKPCAPIETYVPYRREPQEPWRNASGRTEEEERYYRGGGHLIILQQQGYLK